MDRVADAADAALDERLARSESERQYSMRCFSRNARARAMLQQQAEHKERSWSCWTGGAATAHSNEPAQSEPVAGVPESAPASAHDVLEELVQETRLALPAAESEPAAATEDVKMLEDEAVVLEAEAVAVVQQTEAAVQQTEAAVEDEVKEVEAVVQAAEAQEAAMDVQLQPKTVAAPAKDVAAPAPESWMQSLANSWKEVNSGRSSAMFLLVLCVAIFFCGLAIGMQLA